MANLWDTGTAAAFTNERYDYLAGEQIRQRPPERLFWDDPSYPLLPPPDVVPQTAGPPGALLPLPLPAPAPMETPMPGAAPPAVSEPAPIMSR